MIDPRPGLTLGSVHNTEPICRVLGYAHDVVANARLIAAAPNLLTACNEIDEWIKEDSSDLTWRRKIVFDVRAAIAKAEGKS